jgi:phosphopantetheine adenylyltransferase
VNVERLATELKNLTFNIPEIKNTGIPILNVVKQLFKDNDTDMSLQLIADITDFESKNDFRGINTAIEHYINTLYRKTNSNKLLLLNSGVSDTALAVSGISGVVDVMPMKTQKIDCRCIFFLPFVIYVS